MQIDLTKKLVTTTQHNRNNPIEERRTSTKKDRRKANKMDEWNVKVPQQVGKTNNKSNLASTIQSDIISIKQLLDEFIQSVISEKYQPSFMHKIFAQAENQPLSLLWQIQYTNRLQFVIQILQKTLKSKQDSNKAINKKHQDEIHSKVSQLKQSENKNDSNIEMEIQDNEQEVKSKKKKKIKKHQQQKKALNLIKDDGHSKDQPIHHHFSSEHRKDLDAKKILEQQEVQPVKQQQSPLVPTIQQLENEISRVEDLYIEQMQNIHILPYVEAESKLQNEGKLSQAKNIIKADQQKIHHFQQSMNMIEENADRHQSHLQSRIQEFQSSQMYPLLEYKLQMDHNFNTTNQQQQIHQMASHHLKYMNISFSAMNSAFNQNVGQVNSQYLNSSGKTHNHHHMNQSSYINISNGRHTGSHVEHGKQMIQLQNDEEDIEEV